jgi:hypothetical protein
VDGVESGGYGGARDVEMNPGVQLAFMYTGIVPVEGG